MKELPAYKATKAAVIADLCRRAQRGDVAARNAVIEANLRLCARIATRYARNHGRLDLLDDLIHEAAFGERGLVRAIERFDPTRSTFAQRAGVYITDAVVTLLKSQQSTTRRGSAKRRARIRSVSDSLEVQLGRRPSSEEVRTHFIGLGGSWVPSLQSIERAVGWSLSEVSYTESELDGPTREHDPSACLDHSAPSEDDLIERIDGERQRDALKAAMAQLEPADRTLLARRFGLGMRDAPTAKKLRPAEAAALQRLREIMTGAKHQ